MDLNFDGKRSGIQETFGMLRKTAMIALPSIVATMIRFKRSFGLVGHKRISKIRGDLFAKVVAKPIIDDPYLCKLLHNS